VQLDCPAISPKLTPVGVLSAANQFSVKVLKVKIQAACVFGHGSPAAHADREAGRNIAIQKIPRPFRGSFTE
jgi:hypothetical protein